MVGSWGTSLCDVCLGCDLLVDGSIEILSGGVTSKLRIKWQLGVSGVLGGLTGGLMVGSVDRSIGARGSIDRSTGALTLGQQVHGG